jgi:hypothetical protein
MEQTKDEVLSELVAIRKEIANLEVRLGHVVAILHKGQICKNEGLCREVHNIEMEMHDIGVELEEVLDKYFNVCDKVREVYRICFHSHGGHWIGVVADCYDKAEDYAWKQFGIDVDRCLNRGG